MPVFSQHLQPFTSLTRTSKQGRTPHWAFRDEMQKKGRAFFHKVVRDHLWIQFEYQVLCTTIAHHLARRLPKKQLEIELINALAMAELLEYLYRDYMYVPREVNRLRREQAFYRRMLAKDFQFTQVPNQAELIDYGYSVTVRRLTAEWHAPRVFFYRIRSLMVSLLPIMRAFPLYTKWVTSIDQTLATPLSHITWLFFIPRLSTNLFLTAKHVLPGPWLSQKEASLGWQTRLTAQLQRRWFELGNDSAWFMVGLLNAFVCVGSFAACGAYISLALRVYDLLATALRAHNDLQRMYDLEKRYADLNQQAKPNGEYGQTLMDFQTQLKNQIQYEKKRFYAQVGNCILMLMSSILVMPLFMFSPAFAICGSGLAVFASITSYKARGWVELSKPVDNLNDFLREDESRPSAKPNSTTSFRFFAPNRNATPYKEAETLTQKNLNPHLHQPVPAT